MDKYEKTMFGCFFTVICLMLCACVINIFNLTTRVDELEKKQAAEKANSVSITNEMSKPEILQYNTVITDDEFFIYTVNNNTVDYLMASKTDIFEGSMKADTFNTTFVNEIEKSTLNTYAGNIVSLFDSFRISAEKWQNEKA